MNEVTEEERTRNTDLSRKASSLWGRCAKIQNKESIDDLSIKYYNQTKRGDGRNEAN